MPLTCCTPLTLRVWQKHSNTSFPLTPAPRLHHLGWRVEAGPVRSTPRTSPFPWFQKIGLCKTAQVVPQQTLHSLCSVSKILQLRVVLEPIGPGGNVAIHLCSTTAPPPPPPPPPRKAV